MAGIDKTYTDSYKDYREFKDWADKQALTFFNGYKVCIGEWVWSYEKEDFNGGEIPIMNTPTWLDIYLIQNCKNRFVLDRMKSVYSEDSYKEFQNIDLTLPPPKEYKQNRKITIKKTETTKFPIHKKPYSYGSNKREWWLQCNDYNYNYYTETKTWSSSYYPNNTNTAHIKSIKGVVRHLRKQYLPKGITFNLSGKYIGEDYLIVIS
jgi:hypothetical protein